MSSNTPNLGLLKKDPMVDGNETFNIETMLNENWDKVDEAVGQVRRDLGNIDVDIPEASLTEKGIVQLSSATNGTRENVAATENAVKAVKDSIPTLNNTVNSTSTTQAATANAVKITYDQTVGLSTNINTLRDTYQPYPLTSPIGDAIQISGTNLNSELKTGFYMGSNMTNAPTTDWWYVKVIRQNANYVLQNAYSVNITTPSHMQRKKINGTWTAWNNMIVSNIDDKTNSSVYMVPEQYPNVQSALNAMKKVNFGSRIIYVASGFVNSGNIDIAGFYNGKIEIIGLDPRGFNHAGNILVSESNCDFTLRGITLTSANSFIQVDCLVKVDFYKVNKTVAGNYAIFFFGCNGRITNSVISNQTIQGIAVSNGANVNFGSMSGTGNACCIQASGGIAMVDNFNDWTGTVKGKQLSGGRVYVGDAVNIT
ncbi:pyocin knob domain-containing protein [Paenibacillus glucanolyticus]|uniref:pyocin knob domain-containing protein n=1 Tax=Paenibacillus glucanolyticus TaxID=59843 RepID=UPI0030C8F0F8